MRTLAWAALPYVAAVFAAQYLLPVHGLPIYAAALAVCTLAALFLRRGARRRAMLAGFAAALGLLWFWGHAMLTSVPAEELSGTRAEITARVTDWPVTAEEYSRLELRLTGEGMPRVRAYLYLYGELPEGLDVGDTIRVSARINSSATRQGKSTDLYSAKGIYLILSTGDTPEITASARARWLWFSKDLCRGVKNACDSLFPSDVAPIMKALLTGDKSDLYEDKLTESAMSVAGVQHIVAVSGMHVMFVVSLLQLLFGKSRAVSLVSLPLVAVFVVMTGAGPSAVRAGVMQGFMLLAPIFYRESDPPTTLSAALALILLVNPHAAASVSLQLSFSCILGLMLLSEPLGRWCARHKLTKWPPLRFVADSLCCTIAATVFSVPLSALYFGSVPLLSPLANLFTLPAMEASFCGGYLLIAVSLLFPAAAKAGAWLAAWLLRWCRLVWRCIALIPFASVYTVNHIFVWWLVLVYLLFFLAWVLKKRGTALRPLVPAALGTLSLAAVIAVTLVGYGARSYTAAVLDVGQGECVALTGGGSGVVIDCGGNAYPENAGDTAADYLLSCGCERVSLLVLTHLHEDHCSGVTELLVRVPVERILLPADADDSGELLAPICAMAATTGTRVEWVHDDMTEQVGALKLSLYVPDIGDTENERGLIVRADVNDRSILITGDMPDSGELWLVEHDLTDGIDALVVGHHGSDSSSSELFLRFVQPYVSIISVGYNSYGHPTEQVLERLAEYSELVLRTDTDGDVIMNIPKGE